MPEEDDPTAGSEQGPGRLEAAIGARRVEPFALRFDPDTSVARVRERFAALAPGTETGESVRVAGRIMLLRRQGKLSFVTVRDGTGDLQLFCDERAMSA